MAKDDWRVTERTVALIERFLVPGARVEHDQWLPELVSGTKRQCDVVIRVGTPPRETLTIVEVQDRSKRIEIGHLEAWLEKRRKLGAQHLICVSVKGFPASVLKEAAQHGETVRLITLTKQEQFPAFCEVRDIMVNNTESERLNTTLILERLVGSNVWPMQAPIMLLPGRDQLVTVSAFVDWAEELERTQELAISHTGDRTLRKFRIAFEDGEAWVVHESQRVGVIAVEVDEALEHYSGTIPVVPIAYEQVGFKSALAWVLYGEGTVAGREVRMKLYFVRRADGSFALHHVEHPGLPERSKVFVEVGLIGD